MSFIIVFSIRAMSGSCFSFLLSISAAHRSSSSPSLTKPIYTGVAAAAGVAADADLRPRGSSSESSSLGGRLSSWRRFLRLLVICLLSASWHFELRK